MTARVDDMSNLPTRLVVLRRIEARHRIALAVAIQCAKRTVRAAEALDTQFDSRFATPSTRLTGSERSPHVPAYAT